MDRWFARSYGASIYVWYNWPGRRDPTLSLLIGLAYVHAHAGCLDFYSRAFSCEGSAMKKQVAENIRRMVEAILDRMQVFNNYAIENC
jgi:hypothetical protein